MKKANNRLGEIAKQGSGYEHESNYIYVLTSELNLEEIDRDTRY